MKGRNIIKKYLCGDINCLSGSFYCIRLFDLFIVLMRINYCGKDNRYSALSLCSKLYLYFSMISTI